MPIRQDCLTFARKRRRGGSGNCLTVGFVPLVPVLLTTLAPLSACGNAASAVFIGSATSKVQEAKALDAETRATYRYVLAVEHLNQARLEAAEADYSDAIRYAELAEQHATIAVEISQRAGRRKE